MYKFFLQLLNSFFTRVNLSKIMIIFSVGFIFRVFINYFGDLNVFVNYLHPLSLIYYSFMASFIVFINEMFSLYQISILPNFMTLFSYLPSFSSIFSTFIHIKYEYFELSSIKQDFSYLFSRMYCHNIIDNPLSDDVKDTLDDSIVLHKNSDSEDGSKNKSYKGKGKGRAHNPDEGVSSKGRHRAHNPDEGVSSKNKGRHRAHYSDEGVSSKNKGKGRAYYSDDQGDSSKNKGKGRAYYDHDVTSQNKGKGRAYSRDQSNFVEGSAADKLKFYDNFRCRLHWFFLFRNNYEYHSFKDFKVIWNKDIKFLPEFKQAIKSDVELGIHKIKVTKNTLNWIFNRRNPNR